MKSKMKSQHQHQHPANPHARLQRRIGGKETATAVSELLIFLNQFQCNINEKKST
jgi:hypothetical protein